MGVRNTSAEGVVALYDSTANLAFGPVFDTEEEAEAFLAFCASFGFDDIRALSPQELMLYYGSFVEAQAVTSLGEANRALAEGRVVPTSEAFELELSPAELIAEHTGRIEYDS